MSFPEHIGRYVLLEQLAAGGMARVYLGRLLGPMGFGRTVAIKRLHATIGGVPQNAAMLLDEARFAARVRHSNVVPILDVVEHNGELILVMEYVHGESLARLLSAAKRMGVTVPSNIVSAIAIDALRGLHAAHEARGEDGIALGLIHRDVSPQNIMVSAEGMAQLLDFGIAKATAREDTTRDGAVKGKVAYMAPEQVRSELLDRRTDLWAMGVVIWQMMTGKSLFLAANDAQMVYRVLEERIPAPAEVTGTESPLDSVVMWALQRDSKLRPSSAMDMALAIEHSVPPATSRVVAEWMQSFASEVLSERAAALARADTFHVEPLNMVTSSRVLSGQATPPPLPSRGKESAQSREGTAPRPFASGGRETAVFVPEALYVAPPPKPVRSKAWSWGLVVAAIGLVGLLIIWQIWWSAPNTTPVDSDVVIVSQPESQITEAVTVPEQRESVVVTPSESAESDAGAEPELRAPEKKPTPVTPVERPTKSRPRPLAKKAKCNPPFTIGPAPDYIRIPKLECLE